jgi:hypothetical protein
MVCGVAGAPYPGYSGTLAGPAGLALAQAFGFYDTLDSVAMNPTSGEGGGCLVVAGSLPVGRRGRRRLGWRRRRSPLNTRAYPTAPRLTHASPPPPPVWDVVPGDQVAAVTVAAAAATSARVHIDGYGADAPGALVGGGALAGGGGGGGGGGGEGPLIVHAATSTTYPISFAESQWWVGGWVVR